jgi:hypothetical protein
MRWPYALMSIAVLARATAADPVAPAAAEPAAEPPPPQELSPLRRTAAIAAALGPGAVVRGAGSWVAGERRTAQQLLRASTLGLVIAGGAGLLVGITGGNEYTIVPGVPLVIGGAGTWLTAWAADVWTAAGGPRVRAPARAPVPLALDAGVTWQHGPYDRRALARTTARVESGPIAVGAGALADVTGGRHVALGDVQLRLRGPAPTGERVADASRLVVRAGVRFDRDASDRVSMVTGELELRGRLDLGHLDRVLDGTFVELATGLGAVRAKQGRGAADLDSILLGRFAWGAYLCRFGEVSVFYDHRRDGLAGGLAAGRAAGFFGSVGATAEVRIVGPWAVRGELELGNAWVSTLALGYRGGPR